MATYALIHGGGDTSFHWHLLEPELRSRVTRRSQSTSRHDRMFPAPWMREAYRSELDLG